MLYKTDKQAHNKQEKILRIKLYKERKWNELWDRIIAEQNKRTNKDKRRLKRKKYNNNTDKSNNYNNMDNINNKLYGIKNDNTINITLLKDKIDKLKYNETDTPKQIIKRLKRGYYKKTDRH